MNGASIMSIHFWQTKKMYKRCCYVSRREMTHLVSHLQHDLARRQSLRDLLRLNGQR